MPNENVTFDLSYLQSISNNDEVFIEDMIGTFINDTPLYLDDIHRYYQEKDYLRLYKTVHKFAPTLVFVGASHRNDELDLLEDLAKESKEDERMKSLIEDITAYCQTIIEQLKTKLKTH